MSNTSQVAKVAGHSEVATPVFVAKLLGTKPTIKVNLQGAATVTPWTNLAKVYPTLGDLAHASEERLLRLRGVGQTGIRKIAGLFKQAGVEWEARYGITHTTTMVPKLSATKPTIKVELRGAATRTPWWELIELGATLGELAQNSERDLLKRYGVGRRAIGQVADLLKKAGVPWVGNDRQVAADRKAELASIVQTALASLARMGATEGERELVCKAIQENKPLDEERAERERGLAALLAANIAALEDDDD